MSAAMHRRDIQSQQQQQHFNPFNQQISNQQRTFQLDQDEDYDKQAVEDTIKLSHRQTRMHPRTVQQSPDGQHADPQLPNLSNESNNQNNDHFYQLQQQMGFDDPRLQKLEASPYRQKLYFKKQGAKNGAIQNIRSPSVVQHQQPVPQNPVFPPPEYFNNIKNSQMRHTQQEGGFQQQQKQIAGGPRSNSILVSRVKQLNAAQNAMIVTDQSSLLPKTFRMTPGATTIQSSVNTTEMRDHDYNSSNQHSRVQSRSIRYYNRVVEKFENKFYQNKTRPSSIKKRAEEIYDENIQLKQQINQLKDQMTLQQTQNKLLNNELEKQNQLMTQILCGAQLPQRLNTNNGVLPPASIIIEETSIKQSELVTNLKRELDKALKEVVDKDNEIKSIHRQTKVTKYKELEEECRSYMNECFRLHKVLKRFLHERVASPSQLIGGGVIVQNTSSKHNLDIAPLNINNYEQINKQLVDYQEKISFLKNQNLKLKDDCETLHKRYEVQTQSIKGFKEQNARFAAENESLKPLRDQVQSLNIEVERLKQTPLEKAIAKEIAVKHSIKQKDDVKILEIKLEDKNNQIQRLQEKINALETSQKQDLAKNTSLLEKNLRDTQQKVTAAETQISQLQQQIQQLQQSQTSSENAQVERLDKEKQQLVNKIADLETEQTALNQTVNQLQDSLKKYQQDSENNSQSLARHQDNVKQLNQDLQAKQIQLAELQKQSENLSTQLKEAKDVASGHQKEIEAVKKSNLNIISQKDEEISQLKVSVKSLQSNGSLNQEKLTQQVEQYTKTIDDLKMQNLDHLSKADALQKQCTTSQQEVTALKTKVESLSNEIEILRLSKESIIDEDKIEKDQVIDDLKLQIEILTKQMAEQAQHMQKLFGEQASKAKAKYEEEIDEKGKEVAYLLNQVSELKQQHESVHKDQKSEDLELMQKLESLMVSLQIKEKDMRDQAKQITELKKDGQLRDEEILELNEQLNAKDAEITTVKNYFEQSELDQDEVRSKLDEITKQNQQLLKTIDLLKVEADKAKKQAQEGSKNAWEMDSIKGQIDSLKEQLEQEKQKQLIEIQSRFTRCLEILQINDVKGLTGFLKSNDKSSDEHLEEFIAMKFNMTKEESTLLIQKVLNLSGKLTKVDVINAFINTIAKKVEIIDNDKTSKAYQQLTQKIMQKFMSVDQFFSMVNLDKLKIMHYYMMEKVLYNVFEQTKGSSLAVDVSHIIHMIITHLLNQSRNFYQIEIRVLKENLEKHLPSAQTGKAISSNGLSKVPPSNVNLEKPKEETEYEEEEEEEEEESQPQPSQGLEPEEEKEEYDYYEEEYDAEVIDEEEKQINQAEDKERTLVFNKAIQLLKQSIKEPKDSGMVIQIQLTNQNEKDQQSPGYSKALSESMKIKPSNPMLQQLTKFLLQGKINLRSFLKVYHVGPKEIPFNEKEFEAIGFEEFVYFVNQQNVFTLADLKKFTGDKNPKLEDALESMLDTMQCMHEIPKIGFQLIELQILVENLELCGYSDYERPKSRKNFDFRQLDLKSIRIMNRLTQRVYKDTEKFMITNKINGRLTKDQNKKLLAEIIEITFKDILKKVSVTTKTKKEKVLLIQKEDFFKKLQKLGLKQQPTGYDNLSQFLRIDTQYPNLLYLKKIVRAIELFNSNGYFNSIGMKRMLVQESNITQKRDSSTSKVKIQQEKQEEEEEYEYYEEDIPVQSPSSANKAQSKQPPKTQQPVPQIKEESKFMSMHAFFDQPPVPMPIAAPTNPSPFYLEPQVRQKEPVSNIKQQEKDLGEEEYYEYYEEVESPSK